MGDVQWDNRAFAEISKSPAMKAVLRAKADEIAAKANASTNHLGDGESWGRYKGDANPFFSSDATLGGTAVARAGTVSKRGLLLQAQLKILNRYIH